MPLRGTGAPYLPDRAFGKSLQAVAGNRARTAPHRLDRVSHMRDSSNISPVTHGQAYDRLVDSDVDRLPADVDAVVRHFGIGEPLGTGRVAEGLLNRGYRLDTTTGRYFLKEYVDAPYAAVGTIRTQHRATARLHRLGLPVAAPLAARDGGTVLALDGSHFALYPWIEGSHRHGTELHPEQCAALGSLLGRVHTALGQILPAPPGSPQPSADPAATARRLDELAERARSAVPREEFDRLAAARLAERRELLSAYAHRRPAPGAAPPTGWVHGDFHPLNLLYCREQPAAIIDWDRLGSRPPAEEAVRAATLFFHDRATGVLDLSRVRRFSRGYRAAAGCSVEEAAAAVHRVWWERLNDFWILEWHYLRGDRRADPLFASAAGQIGWWCEEYEQVLDAYVN